MSDDQLKNMIQGVQANVDNLHKDLTVARMELEEKIQAAIQGKQIKPLKESKAEAFNKAIKKMKDINERCEQLEQRLDTWKGHEAVTHEGNPYGFESESEGFTLLLTIHSRMPLRAANAVVNALADEMDGTEAFMETNEFGRLGILTQGKDSK